MDQLREQEHNPSKYVPFTFSEMIEKTKLSFECKRGKENKVIPQGKWHVKAGNGRIRNKNLAN